MIVTAILAIRNEEAYLSNCLRHLARNGLHFAIIDHSSTDASPVIYRHREFAANLVEVWESAFTGVFSLEDQLRRKLRMAEAVGGDWILHLDADEMMHSYRPGESLFDAFRRLNADGWNAVNFDEFVFLPIERDYPPQADGFPNLAFYYFFEPTAPRLMRAWRNRSGLTMVEHGGHLLTGPDLQLAPERFALRHYMVRSQTHAFDKYTTRVFDPDELTRGWHGQRTNKPRECFRLPPAEVLKRMQDVQDCRLDRSDPWRRHFWQIGDHSNG